MTKTCQDTHDVVDYHDFTDINTPLHRRRALNVGDVYINAATCLLCKDYVRSRNRHDFRNCKCGNLSVDGGSQYCKRVGSPDTYVNDIVAYSDVSE